MSINIEPSSFNSSIQSITIDNDNKYTCWERCIRLLLMRASSLIAAISHIPRIYKPNNRKVRGVIPEDIGILTPPPNIKNIKFDGLTEHYIGHCSTTICFVLPINDTLNSSSINSESSTKKNKKTKNFYRDCKISKPTDIRKKYCIKLISAFCSDNEMIDLECDIQKMNPSAPIISDSGLIQREFDEDYCVIMEDKGWGLEHLIITKIKNDKGYILGETHHPCKLPLAQSIAWQCMKQIECLHNKGVCHRDIKLSNILIDSSGEVSIIDYGMSSTSEYMREKEVGSIQYRSPEIFNLYHNSPSYTKKVDIFSFGIMLLNLLTGDIQDIYGESFSRGYGKEDCIARTHTSLNALRATINTNLIIPDTAKDLVLKMIVLDPEKRLTAQQVLEHEFFAGMSNKPDDITKISPHPVEYHHYQEALKARSEAESKLHKLYRLETLSDKDKEEKTKLKKHLEHLKIQIKHLSSQLN